MTFICYERCGTCKKAKAWLEEKGVAYDLRPIKEANPSYEELNTWHQCSGLPLRKFFNITCSVISYRYLIVCFIDNTPYILIFK